MSVKVNFKTLGCKVNQYETELLREQIHLRLSRKKTADDTEWYVINTCTVTSETDRTCRYYINKITKENPRAHIVVTGCYAERASGELTASFPHLTVIGQRDKSAVVSLITGEPGDTHAGLSHFNGHARAFVKVQDGCDAYCSYCIVPYVRSTRYSRPYEDVMHEVKNLLRNGYKELVLTGIRLGKYADHAHSFIDLIEGILALEGDFRLRLSSLELQEIHTRLITVMKNSVKLCRHLHIPLQSGDSEILRKMKRPYTADEFAKKIKQIKRDIRGIGITTDVIVGYPGETRQQFEHTLAMVNSLEFSRLHVFRFSPRQGASAALEKQTVSIREISRRMNIMQAADTRLRKKFADALIGTTCRVLAEHSKRGSICGLTDEYVRVMLPSAVRHNMFITGKLAGTEGSGYAVVPH